VAELINCLPQWHLCRQTKHVDNYSLKVMPTLMLHMQPFAVHPISWLAI